MVLSNTEFPYFSLEPFSHEISYQFVRIHTSPLINTEKILNRTITNFYNSNDVNVIAAELRLTEMRLTSSCKKHNFA